MAVPDADKLADEIARLYSAVTIDAAFPAKLGVITAQAAQLQAASIQRLTLAIEKGAEAQRESDRKMVTLANVGVFVGIAAVFVGVVQLIFGVISALS